MRAELTSQIRELQEHYLEGSIRRREFIRLAALMGVSMSSIGAFLAAACTPASSPVATPTLPELAVGVGTFVFETLDPITEAHGWYTTAPIFDFLISTGPRGESTGIAERWEMAPDGLSWTFFIRKGVTFHDGSALTAQDVKFSLDRYASKDAFQAYIRTAQERVEVLDDYTVRVYTQGPQPYYWRFVNSVPGFQGMIMPRDYIEQKGLAYFKLHPVGSGPFKFVRHISGDVVEYEAVDKHYRNVPAVKKLTLLLIPEEATRVAMLKTGQADVIDVGIDSAATLEAAGLRVAPLGFSQATVNFFGVFDSRAKGLPVADVKVREALSLAINRDEISRSLFAGRLQPPMPPTMWPTQPEIDAPYWMTEAAKYYHYEPAEAKRLLGEAGYPEGFTIKLYSVPDSAAAYLPKLAPIIQGYWAKIGVKAEIVNADRAGFSSLFRKTVPVDQLVGQASLDGIVGGVLTLRSLSTRFSRQGQYDLINSAGGQNSAIDTLISAGYGEVNDAKRSKLIAEALRLIMDTRVTAVIGTANGLAGMGARVDISFPMGAPAIPPYLETAKRRLP